MRFVAPVCGADEVEALVGAGAAELYCGLLEPEWAAVYGNHDSISRRQGRGNLQSKAELAQLIAKAQELRTPVYLTMNSRYTEPQLDYLTELCLEFEQMGGTGLQLFDLGLLERLRGRTQLKLCLSILAVAQNAATLVAYRKLGIRRAVLPRFMQPTQMAKLLAAVPGIEGEAMVFFDKCHFVDGYCRYYHGVAYRDAELDFVDDQNLTSDTNVAGQELPTIYSFDTTFSEHGCAALGFETPAVSCAACDLPALEAAGIELGKIGGRGLPLADRLQALQFLMDAQNDNDPEKSKSRFYQTFNSQCNCYYGTSSQSCAAIETRNTGAANARGDVLELPPQSEEDMPAFLNMLEELAKTAAPNTELYINDLGSYLLAAATLNNSTSSQAKNVSLRFGSLLARTDCDPRLQKALDAEANPTRIVSIYDGHQTEPAILKYKAPTPELQRHWRTPSITEPSAQQSLAFVQIPKANGERQEITNRLPNP